MITRKHNQVAVPLNFLVLLGILPCLNGWVVPPAAYGQAGAKVAPSDSGPQGKSGEESAIRAVDAEFVRLYNSGDVKGLATLFTEDAEVVEADGARYQGRSLVERAFADTFAADKGTRIELEIATIRFLTPDVAKEEGRSVVRPVKGAPVARFYTVLFVKRDNRWMMSSVREEADPLVSPRERLQEMDWMIGEWIDQGPDSETRVNCHWSADKNFLLREYTVKRAGKIVMTVTQRLGWDPVAMEFRSWEFDSEGGFGEGRWSRDGDRWVVKQTGVRPEGVTASSTRVSIRTRPDQVRWTLLDRVVAGEAIPGEETSVLTRVPPSPGIEFSGPATPKSSTTTSPSPNKDKERSPK